MNRPYNRLVCFADPMYPWFYGGGIQGFPTLCAGIGGQYRS